VSLRSTAGPGQAFNYARNDRRAGRSGSGDDVAGAGKATSAPGAIAQALKDDLLDDAIAPGTRLTEEALSTRLDAMCSYRLILEMGALRLALVVGADFSEVSRAVEHLESLTEETAWRHVIEAHTAVHRRSSRPAATRAWSPHIGPVRTSST
jgi:DNA-binding GntR family transcriptional regulator